MSYSEIVYEVRGPIFFGAATRFTQTFERADLKSVKVVVFRMNAVTAIDETGLRALEVIAERLEKNRQRIVLCHVPAEARRKLDRFGFTQRVGEANVVPTFADAVARARRILDRPLERSMTDTTRSPHAF